MRTRFNTWMLSVLVPELFTRKQMKKEADLDVGFARCACQLCQGPFEIPLAYLGHQHECPHCHRETKVVKAPQANPPPPIPELPKRVQSSERTALGMILISIGYFIAVPATLYAIAAAFMLYESESKSSPWSEPRAEGLGVGLIAVFVAVFGATIASAGRRHDRYWICSACGNRLTSKEAILCAVCGVKFR